ncbi:MAG TPA: hypothetical protein VGI21_08750 [Streptosporangiaceae bacterium]
MSRRNTPEAKARRRRERAERATAPAGATIATTGPDPQHEPVILAADLPPRISRAVRAAVEAAGIEYEPGDFGGFPRQTARLCLVSNARLALRDPHLTYVEGVAWIDGYAAHHAWLADEDGRAIETVWSRVGERYVGVPTPDREVRRALRGAKPMFTGLLTGRA